MSIDQAKNEHDPVQSRPLIEVDREMEDAVSELENHWAVRNQSNLDHLLQQLPQARYHDIGIELVRVDAELSTDAGVTISVDQYVARFPKLFSESSAIEMLKSDIQRLSSSVQQIGSVDKRSKSKSDEAYPSIGNQHDGFDFIGELGRGAFSRVYVAAQQALSNRLVTLKLSNKFPGEASVLARLQHKNIVPIYSTTPIASPGNRPSQSATRLSIPSTVGNQKRLKASMTNRNDRNFRTQSSLFKMTHTFEQRNGRFANATMKRRFFGSQPNLRTDYRTLTNAELCIAISSPQTSC
jgi:hypothetical protein